MKLPRFMITDGRGLYLRRDASGNYVPVKNKALGDVWEQRGKASNVLVNCISRNLRDRYRILEVEDAVIPKPEEITTSKTDMVVKSKDDVAKRIGNEPVEDNQLSSLSVDIDNFAGFIQNAEQRNMKEIDSLNFVKLDILGLDNIGLIYI